MNIKEIDLVKLSRLTSQQIDHITCLECCKYFIAPETAACGHTLCHCCWRGRHTCPSCAKPFERRDLRHNRPLQNLTEHVHALGEAFEKLFKIKLDEFLLDTGEIETEIDPTKDVKDWLASSQNHFSAPAQSSDQSSEVQHNPCPLELSSNKIQIHNNTLKTKSPEKVVHVSIPQDDWDKIEHMPDTENVNRNKENVIGPMDIEPFYLDDNEYTMNNPRRSSRKKETKPTDASNKTKEHNSLEKQSSKDSSVEIDKKSNKTKQNWNNVKRMKKEFSKLNKKNRNKLNVSIEMCKKTQSTAITNVKLPQVPSPQVYDIDENTPDHYNIDREMKNDLGTSSDHGNNLENKTMKTTNNKIAMNNEKLHMEIEELNNQETLEPSLKNNEAPIKFNKNSTVETDKEETTGVTKLPFYKKSALYPNYGEVNTIKTINHNVDTNTSGNDDIEISIKVGNTITNIYIKKKNDVELKVNTDREIQTSLGPDNLAVDGNVSSLNTKTQNIVINVGDGHNIDVSQQPKKDPAPKSLKNITTSIKTTTEKKNTDSADTVTAQFEITESVEKELFKTMEFENVEEQIQTKHAPITEEIKLSNKQAKTPKTNVDDLNYLNDLDIFDSGSVKESNVHLLKNTEHAPSEILVCTVQTKNKTQKRTEKRDRDINDGDIDEVSMSKKAKLANENRMVANEAIEPNGSEYNEPESEPMNYDSIMGKVFASIDADIQEIRQSQNIDKHTYTLNDKNKDTEEDKEAQIGINKGIQKEIAMSGTNEINCSVNLNEHCDQKDSENIFSVCVDKEDEIVGAAATNEKMPANVPHANIEDFLTPVMCRNFESTCEVMVVDNDDEMVNDDSDKSVVEETPQKTSFSKMKQKSNGANKESNDSQRIEPAEPRVLTEKKSSDAADTHSIVNLTDASTEIKSTKDATVIETVNIRHTLETPLNINKFVDQIKHKSTPVARKSLNFETENMDDLDPEQTLCPTTDAIAKTTQEKEFMSKAFEKSPTTPAPKPLGLRQYGVTLKKNCIAGSCLTSAELAKLKLLCSRNKWTYSDKYSKDLTHLVVGVDEENRSQRSVKYMCALASSKWIISYEWVEKCLQTKDVINEEHYEALDSTGEPGPRRSRVASTKLFQGITFFCMEPFSVLDVDTLKGMLEAAGGSVVKEVKDVRVTDKTKAPAILLAEPENTQEDRFIYLAMELSIVPVNYEWVLNCLGGYALGSIQELLLCPATLLPKATQNWPQELIARDDD